MTRGMRVLAVLCSGLALAACGSSAQDASEQTFTPDDEAISVEAGARFRVGLEASPGIGDDWRLVEPGDQAVVELIGEEWVSEVEDPPPGSSGTTVFTFQARGTGTTELEFYNCYRCGSSGTPPPNEEANAETVRFDVVVS
jgi:inhibitor of cysteine peptidase